MSKKKYHNQEKPKKTDRNAELEKIIGENMSILKGGKVISIKQDPNNKKKVIVEYEQSGKTYNI